MDFVSFTDVPINGVSETGERGKYPGHAASKTDKLLLLSSCSGSRGDLRKPGFCFIVFLHRTPLPACRVLLKTPGSHFSILLLEGSAWSSLVHTATLLSLWSESRLAYSHPHPLWPHFNSLYAHQGLTSKLSHSVRLHAHMNWGKTIQASIQGKGR